MALVDRLIREARAAGLAAAEARYFLETDPEANGPRVHLALGELEAQCELVELGLSQLKQEMKLMEQECDAWKGIVMKE